MFHYLILALSVLANSLGAPGLAQKIEQPAVATNRILLASASQQIDLLGQLPIPRPVPHLANLDGLNMQSQAYLVYDAGSGTVLAERKGYDRRPIASTVKIMTALLVVERGKLDDVITISPTAAAQPGSSAGLRANEQLKVKDVLVGLLLNSGNDAAMALAEYISGSKESFVTLMNKRAQELGLVEFHAADPAGLDESQESGTVASPHSLAKLLSYALRYKTLQDIMMMEKVEITDIHGNNPRTEENSNRFVKFKDSRARGGKTGTGSHIGDGGAGHVLVAAAEQDGHLLIGVAAGTLANTPTASYEQVKKLFDFSFANLQP